MHRSLYRGVNYYGITLAPLYLYTNISSYTWLFKQDKRVLGAYLSFVTSWDDSSYDFVSLVPSATSEER